MAVSLFYHKFCSRKTKIPPKLLSSSNNNSYQKEISFSFKNLFFMMKLLLNYMTLFTVTYFVLYNPLRLGVIRVLSLRDIFGE